MSTRPSHAPGEHHVLETNLDHIIACSVGSSLRTSPQAPRVAHVALDTGVVLPQLEASVRVTPEGRVSGCRMMVEQASVATVLGLAGAFGVEAAPIVRSLLAAAHDQSLPLIAGWDCSTSPVAFKLYVNASDSDAPTRERLGRRLMHDGDSPLGAPHLVGANVSADGVFAVKLYEQLPTALGAAPDEPGIDPSSGAPTDTAWRTLEQLVPAESVAGRVRSWDLGHGEVRPRALFLALRDGLSLEALAARPGWRARSRVHADSLLRALPFEPGNVRSAGVALVGPAGFTLYVKPQRTQPPVFTLEPAVRLRVGDTAASIDLFVVPNGASERAYARTAAHAISYRVSGQSPAPALVEQALRWAIERVERWEGATSPHPGPSADAPPRALWDAPPVPWNVDDR